MSETETLAFYREAYEKMFARAEALEKDNTRLYEREALHTESYGIVCAERDRALSALSEEQTRAAAYKDAAECRMRERDEWEEKYATLESRCYEGFPSATDGIFDAMGESDAQVNDLKHELLDRTEYAEQCKAAITDEVSWLDERVKEAEAMDTRPLALAYEARAIALNAVLDAALSKNTVIGVDLGKPGGDKTVEAELELVDDKWRVKSMVEREEPRDCICADPENCTTPVPGYRCKRKAVLGVLPQSRIQTFEEWYARIGCRIVSDNERARAAFDFGYELRAGEAVHSQVNSEKP